MSIEVVIEDGKKKLRNGNHVIYPRDEENNVPLDSMNQGEQTLKLSRAELIEGDAHAQWSFGKKAGVYCVMLLLLGLVAVFCSLYVVETQREEILQKRIDETDMNKITVIEPCFKRARAERIPDLKDQPEYIKAVWNSVNDIGKEVIRGKYTAISITVTYFGEEIWEHNYSAENSRQPTADTPFPVASVSKLFPVLLLNKLVEKGVIQNLDDPINLYEPRFSIVNYFNSENVTFRQLSCMMSGLPRESPCWEVTTTNYCPHNTTEMLQRIAKLTLSLPPIQAPSYSNLGSSLLGRVLEVILRNESMEGWLQRNVFQPLQMTNTGFDILNKKDVIPISYNEDGSVASIVDWGWSRPSGGMYSTSRDLGKLSKIFLERSTSEFQLSKQSLHNMFDSAYTWPDGSGQGCPFEISSLEPYPEEKQKRMAYISYSKDGSMFGYGSMFNILPDLELNVNVVLANSQAYAGFVLNIVLRHFSKAIDQILKRRAKKYVLPPHADHYTGTYALKTPWPLISKPVRVYRDNGLLLIDIEWFTARLSHFANHTLETRNYNNDAKNAKCFMLGIGLLREKYIFDPPVVAINNNNDTAIDGNSTLACPGFYVNGIATYGYARFERIIT